MIHKLEIKNYEDSSLAFIHISIDCHDRAVSLFKTVAANSIEIHRYEALKESLIIIKAEIDVINIFLHDLQYRCSTDDEIKDDMKEIAHYYGGWPELRKVIDQLEENDDEAAYERSHYEGDGNFADNH